MFRKLYGEQAKFFEMELAPRMKHSRAGLVSMVNNGQNMHGSQVKNKIMATLQNLKKIVNGLATVE